MSKLIDKALSFSENIELIKKKAIKAFSGNAVEANTRLIDNIICFMGVSGGVGNTTLIANLGYLLSRAGLSVALVDLNLEYPNLHTLYGLKTKLKQPDLVTFIHGRNELGRSLYFAHKVALLYPANRTMLDKVNCDKEIQSRNLADGLTRLGKLFDVVLIDCNRDVGFELINNALYISDKIYLVMDDGINGISNYTRIIRNMGITGIDVNKVSVVMNKRTSVHYYSSVLRELETGEQPTIIPFELGVIESGLRGELFCKSGASSGSTGDVYNEVMNDFMHQLLDSSGMYRSSRPKRNLSELLFSSADEDEDDPMVNADDLDFTGELDESVFEDTFV